MEVSFEQRRGGKTPCHVRYNITFEPMRQYPLIGLKRPPSGDVLAVGLSAACLLHCLAVPMVTGSLVLAGSMKGGAWLHWALVAGAFPLSAYTLTRPHGRGVSRAALALGFIGLALLISGAAGFPQRHLETPLTVVGAGAIIIAHGLNRRHRRRSETAGFTTTQTPESSRAT